MAEVIPSINVRTFEEAKERIAKIEPHVRWCHLDVTDGIFSKHPTWRDPRDLLDFETSLNVEVHLMVNEPEKIIDQWLVGSIKRVIVHLEAATDMELIIKKCRDAGIETGIAINPETSWKGLEPWFKKADIFQVLTVHPGPSGQIPDWPVMLDKITNIRKSCLKCRIEVDGGINQESAKKAQEAGADLLVAGAYLFGSPDIKFAIDSLKFSEVQPR